MKRHFKFTALLVCVLVFLFGVCGCKGGVDLTGSYRLHASDEETKYAVTFELSDPQEAIDSAGEHLTTTKFTRLKGVYFKLRALEEGAESVTFMLERCVLSEGNATYVYRGKVEAASARFGVWINPFDFSKTAPLNLIVESFMFYRLSVTGGDAYIEEIVFIGEVLSERGSAEGTGEFILQPTKLLSATPYGEEKEDEALRRARMLVDLQPVSADEVVNSAEGNK